MRKLNRQRAVDLAAKAVFVSFFAQGCASLHEDLQRTCDSWGRGRRYEWGEDRSAYILKCTETGYDFRTADSETLVGIRREGIAEREKHKRLDKIFKEKSALLIESGKEQRCRIKERMEAERKNREAPKPLEHDSLAEYVRGKQVVLFGEAHNLVFDNIFFTNRIIPLLAQNGFHHLGVELDADLQPMVDDYTKSGSKSARGKLAAWLKGNADFKTSWDSFLDLVDAAAKAGMIVVCIDRVDFEEVGRNGLDKSVMDQRDAHMKMKVDELLGKGNKVAVFVGALHASFQSDYRMGWDSSRIVGGEIVVKLESIIVKPLGKLLALQYGEEKIGAVDITGGCKGTGISVCLKYPEGMNPLKNL